MTPSRGAPTHKSNSAIAVDPSIAPRGEQGIAYTFGTLVTDFDQYRAMCASALASGFITEDCEYRYIDNSASRATCAYRGLNALLSGARGRCIILCHQDVRFNRDSRATLDRRLAELDRVDPDWAVAGNAGAVRPGELARRISDPHGMDQKVGTFPQRVVSLDENFIAVRRAARIGFSRNLSGYHFYGADICLAADVMGYGAWVIDFHLEHLSGGKKGPDFQAAEAAFRSKWSRALRPRWIQTTYSLVHISGARVGHVLGTLAERPFASISRRLPSAQGWKAPWSRREATS